MARLISCISSLLFSIQLAGTCHGIEHAEQQQQQMNFHSFDDRFFNADAVCNDGSRGGYYFAEAINPDHATTFVISLPGGGQCYDYSTCTERTLNLTSSTVAPPYLAAKGRGLLDSNPSLTPLWGANKASLLYCSSDGYIGNVGASEATWNMHFRGQVLVESLITALKQNHGLASATKIYLSGQSAGARGMMAWIDKLVADYLPSQAEVIGFLDSPYYLDVEPYSSSFEGFPYQEQQKYLLFNTVAVISEKCGSAFPPSEQWKCQFGQYRMPFVETPYFLISSQFDLYQLSYLILTGVNKGDASTLELGQNTELVRGKFVELEISESLSNYINNFAALMLGSTQKLADSITEKSEETSRQKGFGIMKSGCFNHAISLDDRFHFIISSSLDFVSIRTAFEEYLRELSDPTSSTDRNWVKSWTDGCHTLDCALLCTSTEDHVEVVTYYSYGVGLFHHSMPMPMMLVGLLICYVSYRSIAKQYGRITYYQIDLELAPLIIKD